MKHFYVTYLHPISYVILAYFVALGVFYIVLYVSAVFEMRQYLREVRAEKYRGILSSEIAPSISMLVPAHNEETSIQESVRALLTLAYPQLEIVVVDDGSTDETLPILTSTFDLVPLQPIYDSRIVTKPVRSILRSREYPNLIVVAKENGGKADSLNAALNISTSELVCALDADTILDPDGLRRLVRGRGCDHQSCEWMHRKAGSVGFREGTSPGLGWHSGRGIPPSVSIRPSGLESSRWEPLDIWCVRSIQTPESARHQWIREDRWRGHGTSNSTTPSCVRNGATGSRRIRA
jgi:glycosyltransferase involved in cell wall biosynthesis